MKANMEMLKKITGVPGVSGHEDKVRETIKKLMAGKAEISTDKLGSVICKKEGDPDGPKVMISGHMDEIGFMVKTIDEKGFLFFTPLGGWWNQVMLAQRVIVMTNNGPIEGIIGSKPPHVLDAEEKKKPVEIKKMFIDVGTKNKEETEKLGIKPGDPVIPHSDFVEMANGDSLMTKAWDDRVGCALFMQVIEELNRKKHPNVIYGVGSVQEEVGLRGAQTSSQLIEPDIGFALEVGIAGDMPGMTEQQAQEKLGEGPVVFMLDRSLIPNTRLRDFVIETAREKEIPYQVDFMEGGGTDAGKIHLVGSGVPSLVLAVPARYIHSHYSIISKKDYENTLKLLVEVITRLDKKTVEKFTSF